jgi:hypothetical protein
MILYKPVSIVNMGGAALPHPACSCFSLIGAYVFTHVIKGPSGE